MTGANARRRNRCRTSDRPPAIASSKLVRGCGEAQGPPFWPYVAPTFPLLIQNEDEET